MKATDYIKTYVINENIGYADFFLFMEKCGYMCVVDEERKIIYMARYTLSNIVGMSLVSSKLWAKNIPIRVQNALRNRLWDIYMTIDKSMAWVLIGLQFNN